MVCGGLGVTMRKSIRQAMKAAPMELERVLWLHGQFRRILAPLLITPFQAGVLLYLRRYTDANMTNTSAALCVRRPTLTEVINDLVRKRWAVRRRSTTDTRVVQLLLSPRENALVVKIAHSVRQVATPPTY
jgi:DNA-binding MarR family transcriptional regulator